MDRQLVDPREKSSVCSTMSSILNHVSVIDLQSLVTIIAILYYTKMEKKRKKKTFFLSSISRRTTFTCWLLQKAISKLGWLRSPSSCCSDYEAEAGCSCIGRSFVVVSSPLLSLSSNFFPAPYSLIGSIWDQFYHHLLLMIRSGSLSIIPGYLWLPVAIASWDGKRGDEHWDRKLSRM